MTGLKVLICSQTISFSTNSTLSVLSFQEPEKVMAPHSSTLAWKLPWTEEPGRLQSMGWQRVGHDWVTSLSLFTFRHWRRKWKPTPVFLPGESQGWGSLVGCCLWSHRVRHDWSDLAAGVSKNKEYLNWENPNGCNVNLPLYEASTWILTMNESGRSGSLVSYRSYLHCWTEILPSWGSIILDLFLPLF